MIAFVNFNHFVVVEGSDGQHVWINDPADGKRRETIEEFSESFTGVVLTFAPGPTSRRATQGRACSPRSPAALPASSGRSPSSPWCRWRWSSGIVLPVFTRIFVDYVLVRGMDDYLVPLLIGMALTAIARIVLTALQTRTLTATRMVMTLTTEAPMTRLLRLPISFFDQRFAGEIADRVRLNEALSGLLTGRLALAAANLISAAFFLAVMMLYHWPLALGVLALALVNVLILAGSTRALSDQYARSRSTRAS